MPNVQKTAGPLDEDAQTRILRFLWRSRAEWSGREIARRTGLSAPACHEALKKLDARGLVQFRRISNAHLYAISPDSYLLKNAFVPFFKALEEMPGEIDSVVRRSLADSPGVLSIVVFGSMATGTARLGSDLDIFVIVRGKDDVKALESGMEDLRKLLFRRFHLPLSPYAQTVAELRQKFLRKMPLIEEILKKGRTIYGKAPADFLP